MKVNTLTMIKGTILPKTQNQKSYVAQVRVFETDENDYTVEIHLYNTHSEQVVEETTDVYTSKEQAIKRAKKVHDSVSGWFNANVTITPSIIYYNNAWESKIDL